MNEERPLAGHVQPMVASSARRESESPVGMAARALPARTMTREEEILKSMDDLLGQVTKINTTLEASLAEGVDLQRLARLLREHRAVTAALWNYHHALDIRESGDIAAFKLAAAVEDALGKPWERGATLKEPSDKIRSGTVTAAPQQD